VDLSLVDGRQPSLYLEAIPAQVESDESKEVFVKETFEPVGYQRGHSVSRTFLYYLEIVIEVPPPVLVAAVQYVKLQIQPAIEGAGYLRLVRIELFSAVIDQLYRNRSFSEKPVGHQRRLAWLEIELFDDGDKDLLSAPATSVDHGNARCHCRTNSAGNAREYFKHVTSLLARYIDGNNEKDRSKKKGPNPPGSALQAQSVDSTNSLNAPRIVSRGQ